MLKSKGKIPSVILLSLLVLSAIMSLLSFTNKLIYAKDFTNVDDATEYAQTKENDPSGKFELNSDFTGVYVTDTSYVTKDDAFYAGQGMYSVDNNTRKVVFCLDPTQLVGSDVTYTQVMQVNQNVFYDLTLQQQKQALVIGYVANELYSIDQDEKYLVAGQLLIWDAIGYDLVTSTGLDTQLAKITQQAEENFDSLAEKLYSDEGKSSLLDTTGQDLLLLENAPIIDLDKIGVPEIDSVPSISSNYYVYESDIIADGKTELLNLNDISKSDFNVKATDKQDGDLTSNVTLDISKVNNFEYGSNEVTLSVTDSNGNLVEESQYLYIVGEDSEISSDQKIILTADNIEVETLDDTLSENELMQNYVELANVKAFELTTGEMLDTTQKVIDVEYFGENQNTRSASEINQNTPAVITVENSASTELSNVSQRNYIFVTGANNEAQEEPYLKAQNITLNVDDVYSDDLLDAVAYDVKDGFITNDITFDSAAVDVNNAGVYPVNLQVKDSDSNTSTLTVYVTVVDDNSAINNTVFISGETVYTDLSTIKNNQDDLSSFILTNSNASAFDITTGKKLEVSADTKTLVDINKPGIYPVTLSATNNTDTATKVIDVVVTEDGQSVPTDGTPYLYANPVVVNLDQEESYIEANHNAFAYDRQDGNITKNIILDSSKVQSNNSGVYPVGAQVTDANGNTSKLITTATILDENAVVEGDVYLTGQLITTDVETITQAQSNLEDFVIQNGNVKAFDTVTSQPLEVTVDVTNLVDVNAPGIYEVGLSSTNQSDTATKQIDVVVTADGEVIPSNGNPYLYAQNVMIDLAKGQKYDPSMHNSFAYDLLDGDLTSEIIIDSSLVKPDAVGVYPVTFTVTDSDANVVVITKTVTIIDDTVILSPDQDVMLSASDFTLNMTDYLAVIDYQKMVLENAKISAFDVNTGESLFVNIDTTKIENLKSAGIYPVEISTTNGVSTAATTINFLLLADDEDYPVTEELPYLYVTDGVITSDITEDTFDFKLVNNAFAYDNQDKVLTDLIKADLSNVKFGEAGVYPIEFTVKDSDGNQTSRSANVTVVTETLKLSASDVIMTQGDIYNQDSVKLHNPVATDTDGTDIAKNAYIRDLSVVDVNTPGAYPVEICVDSIFTPGYTQCTTSNVIVLKEGEVVDPSTPYIYAEDVTVDLLTQEYDPALHNAFAYDTIDGVITDDLKIDSSQVENKVGVYPVEFDVTNSTGVSAQKQSFATLTDDTTVESPNKDVLLSAINVYTDVSTISDNLDNIDAFLIDNANISAQETDTGLKLEPTIVEDKLIEAKPGIYPVTITATHTTSLETATKTIDVVVTEDGQVIDETKPYIYASDVIVDISKEETYDVSLHNGFAYDKQDGDLTSQIQITQNVDDTKIGTYPVEFNIIDSNLESNQISTTALIIDDSTVISPNQDVMLAADNIYTDVTTITNNITNIENFIKQEANVQALEVDSGLEITPTYEQEILAAPGIYPVTITAKHSSSNDIATKTIDVVVTLDGETVDPKIPYLYAQDVIVDMSKEEKYDTSLHNAFAYDVQDGDITSQIQITQSVDDTKVGVYPADLKVVDSSNIETNLSKSVSVIDDSAVISPDGDVLLSANNIYTNVSTINDNLDDIDSFITQYANVIAQETDTGLTITPNYIQDIKAKPGVYPVTITATHSVSLDTATKSIDVVVTPDDEQLPTDGTPYVYSEDVTVDLEQGQSYNETLHNAFAYDIEDGDITPSIVTNQNVDDTKVGVYPVEFKVTDSSNNSVKTSSTATIIDDSVVFSPDQSVLLAANNIYTDVTTINDNLSDLEQFIKVNAQVVAVETDTGDEITPTYTQAILAKPGIYPVKIVATHPDSQEVATKIIDVVVTQDGETIPTDATPYIYANNTIVDLSQGQKYDPKNHEAFAYDVEDGDITPSIVTTQNVDDTKVGVYPVTFEVSDSSQNQKMTTKSATIIDDTSVITPEGDVMLSANNIYTDVTTINDNLANIDDFITTNANIVAQEIDTTNPITPIIKQETQIIAKPGVYPVTITAVHSVTGNSAIKTIDVVVTQDGETVPTDGTPYVYAQDVFVDTSLGEKYDVASHEAFAYDKEDGDITNNLVINQAVDDTKIGSYPVDFTITDSANLSATIAKNAVIIDDSVILSPDKNVMLSASNIYTDVTTIENNLTMINEFILTEGNVSALELDTNTSITPVVTPDVLIEAKPGIYPVTISATHSITGEVATKTIDLVVTPDGQEVPNDGTPFIYADQVIVDLSKGEVYQQASHNAFAYDKEDGDLTNQIVIDSSEVKLGITGSYMVDFSVTDLDSNSAKTKKTATLIDENGVLEGNVYLTGETIYTDVSTIIAAQSDLNGFVTTNGKVSAYDTVTSEVLDVTIDTSTLVDVTTPGVYTVKLESSNQTNTATKVIDVVVTIDGAIIDENDPYLYAQKVVVDQSLGESYDVESHNAFAYDRQDGDITTQIVSDPSLVQTKVGVYPVTFTVSDTDTNVANNAVTAAIIDDNSVISPNQEIVLNAQDFVMNLSDYLLVSDYTQMVIDNAKVSAYDTNTGLSITPTFDASNISGLTKPGVYPITLSASNTTDSVEKTINFLLLADDQEYPSDETVPYLYATDGVITEDILEADFDYLVTNNAFAYDNQDGDLTSQIVVDTSQVSFGEKGKYPVKFSITDADNNVTQLIVELTITSQAMELSASDAIINQGDIYDASSVAQHKVLAIDTDGTDISSSAYIKDPLVVDTANTGITPVEICVDSQFTQDYTTCVTQNVVVLKSGEIIDPEAPYITSQDVVVNLDLGQTYDPEQHNAFAYDMQDKDITANIMRNSDLVENKVGVYPVDFEITDSSNLTSLDQSTATVIDDSVVFSPENDVMLSANSIITDVTKINDNIADINQFILKEANVLAQETDTAKEITPVLNQDILIEAKPGIYPVTITATHSISQTVATKTIDVVVTSDGETINEDNPYIYANDVVVDTTVGETYDVLNHNVFAYDVQDGNITSQIKTTQAVDQNTAGVYPVEFMITDSSANTTTLNKKAIILDETSTVSPNNEVFISANNIYTDVSTINSNLSDIESFITTNADVVAIDTQTGNSLAANYEQAIVDEPGIYPVTISAKASNSNDTATKVIDVVVTNDGETIDPNEPYISAKSILVDMSLGQTYQEANHKAFAYDMQDGDITSQIVTTQAVDDTKVGVYPVNMVITDSSNLTSQIDKTATIVDEDTIISTEYDVLLDADNIYTDVSTISQNMGDIESFIIDEANVIAQETDSGKVITPIFDQFIEAKPGVYTVGITATHSVTYSKAAKTIDVVVLPDGETMPTDGTPYVYANDLTVDTSIGQDYQVSTDLDVVEKHGGFAYDVEDGLLTETITTTQNVDDSKVGIYPVTFDVKDSDNNQVSLTKMVSITDGQSVLSPNGDVMLSASNIYTDVATIADNITAIEEFIIQEGKISAFETDTATSLTPKLIQNPIIEPKPGIYPVTVSATHTTTGDIATKVIDVVVTLDGETIPTDGTPYIYAESIKINTGDEYNQSLHNSFAYDVQDGDITSKILSTSPTIDTSKFGIYKVKFEVEDTDLNMASRQTTVTVMDDQTVTSPQDDVALTAQNVYTNVETLQQNIDLGKLDDYILTESQASAFEMDTTNVITPTVDITSIKALPGIYQVDITAKHTNGNKAVKTIDVVVAQGSETIDPNIPYVYANNLQINVGDTYDGLTDHELFAYDVQDGDITSEIKVDNTTVDTSQVAIGQTTFSVTDSSTNTATTVVDIATLDVGETMPLDSSPYIYGADLTIGVDSEFTVDLLNAFAFDLKDGDISSDIVYNPDTIDTSIGGLTEVSLDVIDSDNLSATTKMVTVDVVEAMEIIAEDTPTNETEINQNLMNIDSYLIAQMGIASNLVEGNDLFTNEKYVATVSDKTSLTDAMALNDGKVVYGVYPIGFTSTNGVSSITQTFDLIVLPGDDMMPTDGTPYIYATDVEVSLNAMLGDPYSPELHDVFAYDMQDGLILDGPYVAMPQIKVTQSVDQTLGDDYPVTFEATDSEANVGVSYVANARVKMTPVNFDYKINSMNLDMKFIADMTPYATSLFDYQLIIKEGADISQGNVVGQPIDISNETSVGEIVEVKGFVSLLEPDTTYNIGLYEVGTESYLPDREEFINGSTVTTPAIDAGSDLNIYSNDVNGDGVTDDLDNFSYIEDVYDFESIGYEEDPQPGRVEFRSENTTDIYTNDLTIAKYHRLYRPFNGNYILASDIDGSLSQTDTRPDYLGGFGTDGFKPVGYKFDAKVAETGNVGYASKFSKGFTGKFDGNGYTINDLYVNRGSESPASGSSYIGIFGLNDDLADSHAEGITPNIYDLNIKNAQILAPEFQYAGILAGQNYGYVDSVNISGDISGAKWLGGVVGSNGKAGNNGDAKLGGRIEYTTFDGTVYNTREVPLDTNVSGAGGIAGNNGQKSTIKYSSSTGTVDGDDNIGGLVGNNERGYIGNSFSSSDVICESNSCGGLVGYNEYGDALVEKSYFSGSLTDPTSSFGYSYYFGGISGYDAGSSTQNYATGDVSGGKSEIGGIAGNGGWATGSFALNDIKVYGTLSLGRVTGTEEVGTQNTYYKANQTATLMNGNSVNPAADRAKPLSLEQLMDENTWINAGYTVDEWDFAPLARGNAPLLKGEDGTNLINQVEVPVQ